MHGNVVLAAASVASLALFFGLFFGLNYPEIVREGWPLTRCHFVDATIRTRYCCSTNCPSSSSCGTAPTNAPACSGVDSQFSSHFSPAACAANATACPPSLNGVCNNGYNCCSNCCQTCQSCSTTCATSTSSGKTSTHCSQSCQNYSCNCSCCLSTQRQACSFSCSTCYTAALDVQYSTAGGTQETAELDQDFGTDSNGANSFINSHPVGSSTSCYYNPQNLSQVTFDVSFTPWKWAVSAIFGMLPLLVVLCIIAHKVFSATCRILRRTPRLRSAEPPFSVTEEKPAHDAETAPAEDPELLPMYDDQEPRTAMPEPRP